MGAFTKEQIYSSVKMKNKADAYWGGPKELEKRFWARAKRKSNGCLIWQSNPESTYGYARSSYGRRQKTAHTVAYEYHTEKEVPKGTIVCHHCDTPKCIEPTHLFTGTHKDNADDMYSKGRWTYTPRDQSGENNPASKLTWKKVRKIRNLYAKSDFTLQEIADKIGTTKGNVHLIVNNRTWVE
jgi:hypothetical protein